MNSASDQRVVYQITKDGFGNPIKAAVWTGKKWTVHISSAKIYPTITAARRARPQFFAHGQITRIGTCDEFVELVEKLENEKLMKLR